MKKWLTVCLLGTMALPLNATELHLTKQIEPLMLNGKELTANDFNDQQRIKLQPGQNQLLFAIDQVVAQDGRKAKLVFPPVVIRFDAQSSPISLSYPLLRDANQAKQFRRKLDFSLLDHQGKPVEYQVDLLPVSGFSQLKDYGPIINEYNLVGGAASIKIDKSPQTVQTAQMVTAENTSAHFNKPTVAKVQLQQDFLTMSATERQEFISWAVKHLND